MPGPHFLDPSRSRKVGVLASNAGGVLAYVEIRLIFFDKSSAPLRLYYVCLKKRCIRGVLMKAKLNLKELKVKSFRTTDKVMGGLRDIDFDSDPGTEVSVCNLGTANLCCA